MPSAAGPGVGIPPPKVADAGCPLDAVADAGLRRILRALAGQVLFFPAYAHPVRVPPRLFPRSSNLHVKHLFGVVSPLFSGVIVRDRYEPVWRNANHGYFGLIAW